MNLLYSYWFFEKALTEEQCDNLLKLKQKNQLETGTIDENVISKNKRKSNVFFTSEPFIYEYVKPWVVTANENAGWNFQFDWGEPAQFTEYKKDGHYGWHMDSFKKPWNRKDYPNFDGKIRKLSVTVTLSEPKEYEGGDLEFAFLEPDKQNEIVTEKGFRKKGSIIVFPSFVWHRVTPVTKGTRNSLVVWWLGHLFK